MEESSSPPNHHATATSPVLDGTSSSPPPSSVAEILEPPSRFSSDSSEVGSPRPESPTLPPHHQQLVSPREERPEAVARELQPILGPTVAAEQVEETPRQTEPQKEYVGYYMLHPAAVTKKNIAKQEREMAEFRGERAGFPTHPEDPASYWSDLVEGTPTSRYLLKRWVNQSVEEPREGRKNKGDDEGNEEMGEGKGKEKDEGEGKGKEKDEGEGKENEK